uniref:Coiled-coil domain-containing protein 181 n=1 Tax=Sphenodon punctatus TaxID=8508 RepID=A0A8D0GHR6_SPHPU
MSDKKDASDSPDTGDSTESGEYEDDFEKDLEWLINEEEKESPDDSEDIETNTDKELESSEEKEEYVEQFPEPDAARKSEGPETEDSQIPEIKQLDHSSDTDSENSFQESKQDDQLESDEEDDEEIKRYILEKIEEANKILQKQEPVNETRERKLKFKDNLVDLEVPPLEHAEADKNGSECEGDVSGRLSQLHISNDAGQESVCLSLCGGKDEEHKDGKILVEKDGKFELLSLRDLENQGFLPPISISFSDIEAQHMPPKSSHATVFGTLCLATEEPLVRPGVHSLSPVGEGFVYFPKPPPITRYRPNSATSIARNVGREKTPRRVQSAHVPSGSTTYCLSPRQKELNKIMVFRAWLQKKKEQMQEEKRIQRAKELEDMNGRQENRDPEEAFRLWLKKKHEEHQKEKRIENLRRQEECIFFFPRTDERERAFKQWLKRKRVKKRAEELATKERSRRLRLEARRAKQIQNILCTISEPKSFRFTDHYS